MDDDDVAWGPPVAAPPFQGFNPKAKKKRPRPDGDTAISPEREKRYQATRARLSADDDGGPIALGQSATSRLADAYRGRAR